MTVPFTQPFASHDGPRRPLAERVPSLAVSSAAEIFGFTSDPTRKRSHEVAHAALWRVAVSTWAEKTLGDNGMIGFVRGHVELLMFNVRDGIGRHLHQRATHWSSLGKWEMFQFLAESPDRALDAAAHAIADGMGTPH